MLPAIRLFSCSLIIYFGVGLRCQASERTDAESREHPTHSLLFKITADNNASLLVPEIHNILRSLVYSSNRETPLFQTITNYDYISNFIEIIEKVSRTNRTIQVINSKAVKSKTDLFIAKQLEFDRILEIKIISYKDFLEYQFVMYGKIDSTGDSSLYFLHSSSVLVNLSSGAEDYKQKLYRGIKQVCPESDDPPVLKLLTNKSAFQELIFLAKQDTLTLEAIVKDIDSPADLIKYRWKIKGQNVIDLRSDFEQKESDKRLVFLENETDTIEVDAFDGQLWSNKVLIVVMVAGRPVLDAFSIGRADVSKPAHGSFLFRNYYSDNYTLYVRKFINQSFPFVYNPFNVAVSYSTDSADSRLVFLMSPSSSLSSQDSVPICLTYDDLQHARAKFCLLDDEKFLRPYAIEFAYTDQKGHSTIQKSFQGMNVDHIPWRDSYLISVKAIQHGISGNSEDVELNMMKMTRVFWGAEGGASIYGLRDRENTIGNLAHFFTTLRMYYKPYFNIEGEIFVRKFFPQIGVDLEMPSTMIINPDAPAYGFQFDYNWTKPSNPIKEFVSFDVCYQHLGLINMYDDRGTANCIGMGISKKWFFNLYGIAFNINYYPHSFSNTKFNFLEIKECIFIQPIGRIRTEGRKNKN